MPWTQIFPLLTDDHLSAYAETASPGGREQLQELFSHRRLGGPAPAWHLIALSLSPRIPSPDLPLESSLEEGSEAVPQRPAARDDLLFFVLSALRALATSDEEATLRIYLDPEWADLAPPLLEGGCEVMLMNHPSAGPNPAKLWRYLALEEKGRAVTFMGIEDLFAAENYLKRNALLAESELGLWRTPVDRAVDYRPINPDRFGCVQTYPALGLLCAFLWHVNSELQPGSSSENWQAKWEDEDLDASFLLAAVYPRAAFHGMLSLIETDDCHSRWLILDIEYATWANPGSEIVFAELEKTSAGPTPGGVCENYLGNALMEQLIHAGIIVDEPGEP